jgi:hypothetical protein
MTRSRRRKSAPDESRFARPDLAALACEVERLCRAVERMATRAVELGADVSELQCTARRRKATPAGLTPLKVAVATTPHSYETCRRWCVRCGVEFGAARIGGHWFVDAAALAAKIKRAGDH